MKKLYVQGLIIIGSFFAIWYVATLVDWMKLFRVEEMNRKAEKKLGDLYWDFFSKTGKVIKDKEITMPVDSILGRICEANYIDRESIKLHILENGEVNAFALPGRHIIIYTGLILKTENESQLAGVICHELAHQEEGHIMKRLIKEVGISVLLGAVSGNNNGQVINETAKLLSSTAYDRTLEKRADIMAVNYMVQADIDPLPFADFIGSLKTDHTVSKYLYWVSTHPEETDRMDYLVEYCKSKKVAPVPILAQASWNIMKTDISDILTSEHNKE